MSANISHSNGTSRSPTLHFITTTPTVAMGTEEEGMMDGVHDETSYRFRTISPVLFGCACVLTLLGLVLSTVFLVFNIRYRNHRLIKMSSPNLNILIVLGTILIYACVILLGIDSNTSSLETLTALCKTRLFLLMCGFTLVYGSLFTKSWRVYRIFGHTGAKRMVIRDNKLIGIIACLLLVDSLIMAIWLIFDPPQCQVKVLPVTSQKATTQSTENPLTTPQTTPTWRGAVYVCHSHYHEIWLLVIYVYKCIILLYGTHLSWATRNVALSAMNDARCIIISVYTCVVLVSMATALSSTMWRWPNVWYSCLALVLLLCTTEVLVLVHLPKILAWKDNPDATMPLSRTLTSSYIATNHGQSFNQVEEELFLLSAENAALKRSLGEKDDTIKLLQSHVGVAKEKLCQLIVEGDGRHDSGCDFDGSSSATSQEDPASIGTEPSVSEKSVTEKPVDYAQESGGSQQNSPVKKKKRSPKKCKGTSTKGLSMEEEAVTVVDLEDKNVLDRSSSALIPPTTGRRESLSVQSIRRRRANSLRSVGSASSQFEELRNCIAKELHQAQHISSNLRDSIAQDLGSCRERPLYYDIARTEGEIMSSLSKSYRLRDDDTHSLASSTFTYDNPVFSRDQFPRRSNSSYRTSRTSRQSSFRSVASIALEIAESYSRKNKNGNAKDRELQWPSYIPPKESKVRSGEPLRVVRSSEAPIVYTRSIYNTYV
ncbi:probable G-protein coupled receptor 156 [Lytechinus pictus]|uniref:probable G-protein coupled receptor 156 n=1 Tax=Lytechinus pictus TaxID=7653 RepID=UPI0030BA01EA